MTSSPLTARRRLAGRLAAGLIAALTIGLLAPGLADAAAPSGIDTDTSLTWHQGWCEQGEGLSVVVDFQGAPDPDVPAAGVIVRCFVGGVFADPSTDTRKKALTAVGVPYESGPTGLIVSVAGVEATPADTWAFSGAKVTGTAADQWDNSQWSLPGSDHRDWAYGVSWGTPTVPRLTPQWAGDPQPQPSVQGSRPTITGATKVGATLTVKPGRWTSGATLTYQWLRANKPIPGATSRTYKLKRADRGTRIKVAVVGRKAGLTSTTKTSAATAKVR